MNQDATVERLKLSPFRNVLIVVHKAEPNGLWIVRRRDAEMRVRPADRDVSAKSKPS